MGRIATIERREVNETEQTAEMVGSRGLVFLVVGHAHGDLGLADCAVLDPVQVEGKSLVSWL